MPGVEVVEPAEQVGRVGPPELDDRPRVAAGLGDLLEAARPALAVALVGVDRDACERLDRARQVDQVVVVAAAAEDRAQVGDGRRASRERAQLGQERLELARDGLARLDQRVHVVEREAQVDERRVGLAHEVRQPRNRVGQRMLLGAERVRRGTQVADQRRQVVAALGERADERRRIDQEPLECVGVAGQLGGTGAATRTAPGSGTRSRGWPARGRRTGPPAPLKSFCSPRLVGGSSVFNSWSRSTAVSVSSTDRRPPSAIVAPPLGGMARST